jgi:replication-associated recombination protein RarA
MNKHPLAKETTSGYNGWDVLSALQKALRRSDEESALYWASELEMSGLTAHCWSRLCTITSEDIGIAEPNLPAQIWALRSMWDRSKARVHLMHAIILLARAQKNRMIDHTCGAFFGSERKKYERQIPDYAFDKHTLHGRRLGRGMEHFLKEGAVLIQPTHDAGDAYQAIAERAWLEADAKEKADAEMSIALFEPGKGE